jgi:hypothetical protein
MNGLFASPGIQRVFLFVCLFGYIWFSETGFHSVVKASLKHFTYVPRKWPQRLRELEKQPENTQEKSSPVTGPKLKSRYFTGVNQYIPL